MRGLTATAATLVLMGAVTVGPVGSALGQQSPLPASPPFEDAVPGWLEFYSDPAYAESYLAEVASGFHVGVPWPFDPVKPELFLPYVAVTDGDYVADLPLDLVDLSAVTYDWNGRTHTVADFLHTTQSDVIAFVHDGVLVYEDYAKGYSPDVRHQPWSVTKTFVGAIIGIAVEEGQIDSLQDPIDKYVTELTTTAWESVTIENLLQMESGVHWDEATPILVQNTQVEQWFQVGMDLYTQGAAGQTRNEFLMSLPQTYEQGTEFRYSSANTQVLAWMLENIYGTTFNELLSEKLWQPMGADGDAVMVADRVGSVLASQGLYARPYDFLRFGELLRNRGVTPDGDRVVAAEWVDAMTTMTELSDHYYGYQTWASPLAAADAYSGIGFQGQYLTVMPTDCLTAVRLSHAIGADLRDGEDPFDTDAYRYEEESFWDQWEVMLRAIADQVGGCAEGAGSSRDVTPSAEQPTADPSADGSQVAADSTLPATGGGLAGLALVIALGGPALRRRRS